MPTNVVRDPQLKDYFSADFKDVKVTGYTKKRNWHTCKKTSEKEFPKLNLPSKLYVCDLWPSPSWGTKPKDFMPCITKTRGEQGAFWLVHVSLPMIGDTKKLLFKKRPVTTPEYATFMGWPKTETFNNLINGDDKDQKELRGALGNGMSLDIMKVLMDDLLPLLSKNDDNTD